MHKKTTLFFLILYSLFVIFNSSFVYAGSFSNAKLTISDSRATQTNVQYDFAFTGSISTSVKQVTIQFCTTASGTCTTPTGFSSTGATRSTDTISGSGRSDNFSTNGTLTTIITTPTTQSPTAMTVSFTGITNPSTTNTTFYAIITTYSDTGSTTIDQSTVAFAILSSTSIAVTADVGNTLGFTVSAVTSGSVNGSTINVAGTTATTIPFGSLTAGSTKIAAHDVSLSTNAGHGYLITVKSLTNPPLQSGLNDIDPFTGTNASPVTWSSPNGTSPNTNTGFFGYTSTDTSLSTGTADRFTSGGGNKWAGLDTTPYEFAYNSGAVTSGETTRIGWQVEVNSIQPAGSYAGSVILVATPTY